MTDRTAEKTPDPPATKETIAHGTKSMAAAQVLTQLTRFATNIVLARLLAPEAFGIVAIVLVICMFLDQVKDAGTGSAIIQSRTVSAELLNTVFYLNLILGAALAVGVAASADVVASLLKADSAIPVLRVFAIGTFVTALGQVHHAMLRRTMRFGAIAAINTAGALCTAAVSIAGALAGMGVWALVAGYLSSYVLDTVLVWVCDRWRPGLAVNAHSLKAIWSYSANLFMVNVVNFFFNQADKLMVSRFLGATPLGIYSMAQRILTYPLSSVSNVVAEVMFPTLARKQDDDVRLRQLYVRSTNVVALVVFPLMALSAVLARPAVDTVLGAAWHDLTPLIWILAPVGAVQAITFTSPQILMAKGRTDILFRWRICHTAVVLAAYVIGLQWGLVGLCAAYAIAIVSLAPVGLFIAFRVVSLPLAEYFRTVAPIATRAAAAAAVVLGVDTAVSRVAPTAVVLVVGAATGAACCAVLFGVRRPTALDDVIVAIRSRRSGAPASALPETGGDDVADRGHTPR